MLTKKLVNKEAYHDCCLARLPLAFPWTGKCPLTEPVALDFVGVASNTRDSCKEPPARTVGGRASADCDSREEPRQVHLLSHRATALSNHARGRRPLVSTSTETFTELWVSVASDNGVAWLGLLRDTRLTALKSPGACLPGAL